MQVPAEISYRDVEKTEAIDTLVRQKIDKLDRICDHITSCRVMIEKSQKHQRSGQPYKVRVDLKIPPGHELAISRDPVKGSMHQDLSSEIRWAFDAAERRLKELMEKQRRDVKKHPFQEMQGVIEKIFKGEGTGFIRTIDGREVYFHQNSVVNEKFEDLKEGAGVRFVESMGEKGPQASTVMIVEGHRSL
ncbi:HPF/RaiA family ribosome-associated protein [Chitinispirillales bacterium ANBcel5]|uniref:HPF/RaiA family ribosome-associated protein n=1 Tax=Cellulosispirillum alkaliphilum TaxID=3039283 RepID=UPI002A541E73|nr:HPF/RaiA family ribosome-associated protein [Chitinispirillales bacterium ANBcel5]